MEVKYIDSNLITLSALRINIICFELTKNILLRRLAILILKSGSDSAIIILHEIYGINPHIASVCNTYFSKGYDVYCPNWLDILSGTHGFCDPFSLSFHPKSAKKADELTQIFLAALNC
ncbi:MAG: dienelactone hydrolase family protein [Acetobacterium sp.]